MPELKLRNNAADFKGCFSRSARANIKEVDESYTFDNILSTENAVIVWDWFEYEPVREIILMKPKGYEGMEINEDRQIVLLNNHSRFDTSDVKGSSRELELRQDEKFGVILFGRTSISETAPIERKLVEEKHLTDTSIGYRTYEDRTIRLAPKESTVIDGVTYKNDYGDGLTLVIRLRTSVFENSLTPLGADWGAKIRGMFNDNGVPKTYITLPGNTDPNILQTIRAENKNLEIRFSQSNNNLKGDKHMDELEKAQMKEQLRKELEPEVRKELKGESEQQIAVAVEAELNRQSEIRTMVADETIKRNLPGVDLVKFAEPYLKERTKSPEQFSKDLLKKMGDPEVTRARVEGHGLGMEGEDLKDYSIRKIILYSLGAISEKEVGLELRYDKEYRKANNIEPMDSKNPSVILAPEMQRRRTAVNTRSMTPSQIAMLGLRSGQVVAGTDYGAALVKDQYIPQSFIELRQSLLILGPLGVQILEGLQGNVTFTREVDTFNHYYAGEDAAITESKIKFSSEQITPHKNGAIARMSYEFMLQADISVEAYIEKRLAQTCALGVHKSYLYGTGENGQPTGLTLQTGIGGVVGSNFNREKALQLEGQIYASNVESIGNYKFHSNGKLRSLLKNVKATPETYLVNEQNRMIGYDYGFVSNIVNDGDLFFAAFSESFKAFWATLEITANRLENSVFYKGDLLVRALQADDNFFFNPGAFTYTDGADQIE